MGNFRWVICALLFMATLINYLDRHTLGILKPELTRTLHWSERDFGWMVMSFQAAYATGLALSGPFIERIGIKGAYAAAIILWSLATIGHAPAGSVLGFCAARFALGIGQGANWPAAIRTTAEWFPQRERSVATGIFNSGSNAGSVLGPLIIPWLALQFSWQTMFVVLGATGFVWLLFWWALYERPGKSRWVKPCEQIYIQSAPRDLPGERVSWRRLFRYREMWAYVAAGILTAPVWWFLLFWLPDVFNKHFGLNFRDVGLPLATVYTVAGLGGIAGGGLSAWLLRRNWSLNAARKAAALVCACCALPVMFATHTRHVWLATACFALAAAANQGWSATIYTVVSDIFPKRAIASVVGIGGMFASLVAVGFSHLVGRILQSTGVYDIILIMCGGAYVTALLLFHLLVPQIKPIQIE